MYSYSTKTLPITQGSPTIRNPFLLHSAPLQYETPFITVLSYNVNPFTPHSAHIQYETSSYYTVLVYRTKAFLITHCSPTTRNPSYCRFHCNMKPLFLSHSAPLQSETTVNHIVLPTIRNPLLSHSALHNTKPLLITYCSHTIQKHLLITQ